MTTARGSAPPTVVRRDKASVPAASSRGKRLDIQGLRALAVTLVVVFHLVPAVLPGGYVGVDVFFVISGFLITAHLVREIEATGRVRIGEFWARRVRRLLPASLLVLVFSAAAALFLLPAILRTQNLTEIAFAAGYILNWHLADSAVDYLNASAPASLVQHYWSLSVEEQFYLVWPVLLMLGIVVAVVFRRLRGQTAAAGSPASRRRAVLVVLLIVIAASFVFSVIETARSQPSAYFITTTRAWEFGLGGLVALLPALRLPGGARAAISWTALVAIIVSAFAFGAGTPFPGSIALIPVAATAALIAVGDQAPRYAPQRWAGGAVVQKIGDLSYSIYLWHWPLIVVLAAAAGGLPLWARGAIVVVVTGVLAFLTERYVERPLRKGPGPLRRQSVTFLAMAACIALIVGGAMAAVSSIQAGVEEQQGAIYGQLSASPGCIGAQAVQNGCPDPFSAAGVDPAFAQNDTPWAWFDREPARARCSAKTVGSWVERSCDFPGAGEQVLLIGDSHADHIAAPVQKVATQQGWGLRMETRQACNPFRTPEPGDDENAARCAEWGTGLLQRTTTDASVGTVIVSTRIDSGDFRESAESAFRALIAAGKRVILVNDIPNVDGREAKEGNLITGPACVLAAGVVDDACSWKDAPRDAWLSDVAAKTGAPVLDLRSVICPDGTCHAIEGGLLVYGDEDHLSGAYALSLTSWFAGRLVPLIDR